MPSFALNYNSAHFIGVLPPHPAPTGAARPGTDYGCHFWAPGQAGNAKQKQFTREREVCSTQNPFLGKEEGLDHTVYPPKKKKTISIPSSGAAGGLKAEPCPAVGQPTFLKLH